MPRARRRLQIPRRLAPATKSKKACAGSPHSRRAGLRERLAHIQAALVEQMKRGFDLGAVFRAKTGPAQADDIQTGHLVQSSRCDKRRNIFA